MVMTRCYSTTVRQHCYWALHILIGDEDAAVLQSFDTVILGLSFCCPAVNAFKIPTRVKSVCS